MVDQSFAIRDNQLAHRDAVMLRLFLVLAAGAATSALPTIANPDQPQVYVQYRDLNLNSIEGTKQLKMRVSHAVAELCGDTGERNLETAMAISRCSAIATASAQHEVELAVNKAGAANAAVTAAAVAIVTTK